MAVDPDTIDIQAMSPDEFIGLVRAHSDAEIRDTFQAVGSSEALDRIFSIIPDYYRPDRAGDIDAKVRWRINDGRDEHHFTMHFLPDRMEAMRGHADDAIGTVTTDIVRFCRIITGQANAVKLLLTRKLKASGDVMFARRIQGFFDIPTG